MELQLELALSSRVGPIPDCDDKKKRSFDQAFLGVNENNVDVPQTLPLFLWDMADGEFHEAKRIQNLPICNRNAEEEDDFAVGWPPVKSWRKQFCNQNRRGCATNYVNVENGGGSGRRSNSKYVKVKMDGVGIARKINLSIHNSYHALIAKLMALFGKFEEHAEEYKLTYQDKEGDWLLTRDLPWETFIQSVQRLKLQRNGF